MVDHIPVEQVQCIFCRDNDFSIIAEGFDYEYWSSQQKFSWGECQTCGHFYLNPRPTPASWADLYTSNYYTLSGKHTARSSRIVATLKKHVIRRRLKKFISMVPADAHVLEIGCGDGSLLTDLKDIRPQMTLTGIDLAFSDITKQQCSDRKINLIEGGIETIDLPQNTYNFVIMNQLIEHLWNPQKALTNIFQAMKKDGLISIETVNMDGYDRKIVTDGKWGGYYIPRHLNLFTFKSLRRLLEECGYTVQHQYSLLAPIIWTFSLHAVLCPTFREKKSLADKFFSDRNPVCLALFTLVDILASLCGQTTSNQKIIAKK
ncbi:MAG: class I SAM-dependent methyltransferase [Candidatus Omnitrophica bacterium]|nr:class I SAM-dependent methyltransferase [Candidatus Omnitrophota bacterium]